MLWPHQQTAINEMWSGCVLVGGTGSGKSRTALGYYKQKENKVPLYVITTAKKRDEGDWSREAEKMAVVLEAVDSWNNIKKYVKVTNSFFIFDEQRAIGSGTWARSFVKITRKNRWIMLSATPADTWEDLIPVFVANNFYKNRTDFVSRHFVYASFTNFPKVIKVLDEGHLRKLANKVLVKMPTESKTIKHVQQVEVEHNEELVRWMIKNQWDPISDKPIESASQELYLLRRVINTHPSRVFKLMEILNRHNKVIVFYNYTFELEILKWWFTPITTVAEYNGQHHQPIPTSPSWVYLVQYIAGSEAWECFTTNVMVFYSLNFSSRTHEQAMGRIDRHNTHFSELYYYEFVSTSIVDKLVLEALRKKKSFKVKDLRTHHEFYKL